MNKIYKTVRNKKTGLWDVASELTKAGRHSGGGAVKTSVFLMAALFTHSAMAACIEGATNTVTCTGTTQQPNLDGYTTSLTTLPNSKGSAVVINVNEGANVLSGGGNTDGIGNSGSGDYQPTVTRINNSGTISASSDDTTVYGLQYIYGDYGAVTGNFTLQNSGTVSGTTTNSTAEAAGILAMFQGSINIENKANATIEGSSAGILAASYAAGSTQQSKTGGSSISITNSGNITGLSNTNNFVEKETIKEHKQDHTVAIFT
ncbi:ESPR domain-containing protein, partial [Snodgrassella sp. CFCC 13594]|uniref:ESPR domain-containing protein n=1 Tax=Snodgrassella sp. CFCC 13594 TaxID=1775559 RepID=UPI000A68EAB9